MAALRFSAATAGFSGEFLARGVVGLLDLDELLHDESLFLLEAVDTFPGRHRPRMHSWLCCCLVGWLAY
jgi:hypothetical protein